MCNVVDFMFIEISTNGKDITANGMQEQPHPFPEQHMKVISTNLFDM